MGTSAFAEKYGPWAIVAAASLRRRRAVPRPDDHGHATPALRKLLTEKEQPLPSRLASPAQVAELVLARLPLGPVYNWGPLARFRASWRRTRVRLVAKLSHQIFGGGSEDEGSTS